MKRVLYTTTCLLLISTTGALADNNEAWLDQSGTANVALIQQTGADNDAGSNAQNIRQVNQRNQLTILQGGSGNAIGLEANSNGGEAGIYQISNRDGVNGNIIDIEQASDSNTVGAISQTSTGTMSNLQRNTVNIEQSGGNGNRVGSVQQWRQSSRGNFTDIAQTGASNTIERVSQYSPSSGGGNARNELNVTMSGDDNGNGVLTGAADMSGAIASTLIQGEAAKRGSNNRATLIISGNTNQFGVTQYGDQNTVGTLTISGDLNEVGTYQDGSLNVIAVAEVDGTFNNVGVEQIGTSNSGSVDISGNSNGLLMRQIGGTNIATAMITGNDNGWNQSLSGNAGLVAGGMPSGLIEQIGDNNTAHLAVTGDMNAFALSSFGAGNTINGSVTGDSNQVAVVQAGDMNTANFTQIGNGNNAGILQ
ncbi:hypothetical protein [Szabonella alba]|uniref:Curlin associated repeat-containing protein n=1 Tax=Szabonella alba TaxID=2804194 RepID=A0A8K0VFL7_9RHOB|nr:hypothetical protein [Szabonella alba]MBL4918890.1 hypothetical protein [Szabonella alba]